MSMKQRGMLAPALSSGGPAQNRKRQILLRDDMVGANSANQKQYAYAIA